MKIFTCVCTFLFLGILGISAQTIVVLNPSDFQSALNIAGSNSDTSNTIVFKNPNPGITMTISPDTSFTYISKIKKDLTIKGINEGMLCTGVRKEPLFIMEGNSGKITFKNFTFSETGLYNCDLSKGVLDFANSKDSTIEFDNCYMLGMKSVPVWYNAASSKSKLNLIFNNVQIQALKYRLDATDINISIQNCSSFQLGIKMSGGKLSIKDSSLQQINYIAGYVDGVLNLYNTNAFLKSSHIVLNSITGILSHNSKIHLSGTTTIANNYASRESTAAGIQCENSHGRTTIYNSTGKPLFGTEGSVLYNNTINGREADISGNPIVVQGV